MKSRNLSLMTIKSLVSWIEDNLNERMQISQIADRAGYSPWHLQRIFKRATGVTLGDYLRGRRLTEAAKTLSSHRGKIIDVAICHGFENQQTFSRAFKDYFGTPPHQYRLRRTVDISRFLPPIDQRNIH